MQVWVLVVVVVGAVLVTGALAAAIWRRQRAESGWNEWRRTVAGLPWRDRVEVMWATSAGRAVRDPRLAELAVQRAERGLALLDAVSVRQRRILLGAAALEGVVAVLSALRAAWVEAALYGAMAVVFAGQPLFVRSERRRLQRSVDANRALLALEP